MEYIHIRQLIYRERKDLDEFGVEDKESINAQIYESLLTLYELNPKHHGVFNEILHLFNDAYFYLTIIFMVKRPLELYPDISNSAGVIDKEFDWHGGSEAREIVVLCMLHILLLTFGKKLTPPQQMLHQSICNDLNEYYGPKYMSDLLAELRGERENVVSKMTDRIQFNISRCTIMKEYYMPRNIQDIIDGEEKLESCLLAGSSLAEAVNLLCKKKEQKLQLIARLLEPEQNHYGVMNSTISAAYRSLYELRADLTGEPLSEKLPFERAVEALGSPITLSSHFSSYDHDEEDYDNNEIQGQISAQQEIPDKQKPDFEDMIMELITDICEKNKEYAKEFLNRVRESSDLEIPGIVIQFKNAGKIAKNRSNHSIWIVLHSAKLYGLTESNFNTAIRKRS